MKGGTTIPAAHPERGSYLGLLKGCLQGAEEGPFQVSDLETLPRGSDWAQRNGEGSPGRGTALNQDVALGHHSMGQGVGIWDSKLHSGGPGEAARMMLWLRELR